MGKATPVSLEMMNSVWPLPLPSVQKFVLLALADRADENGTKCYPSVKWIMERTSLSERTVQRAIGWLSDHGHLTVEEKPGHSSSYLIHPRQSDTPSPVTTARASESHPRQSDGTPPSERRDTPVRATGHPRQPDTHIRDLSLLDPSLIPPAPPKVKKSVVRKSSTMPEDYNAEHMRAWTASNCPGVDFDTQLRMLRDYEFRTPRSKWDAVVRTWMTRAMNDRPKRVNGYGQPAHDPPRRARPFGQ